jgi:RecA/RadA recombinase
MTGRADRLAAVRVAANKKYGSGTIELAGRQRPMPGARLTTGSLSFDYAMGGGLPVGHITIFRGSESSGKTTAATRIAGMAQEVCANCYRRPTNGVTVEDVIDKETGEVTATALGTCDCVAKGLYMPRQASGEDANEFKARLKRYQENSFEEFRVAYLDIEGTFDDAWAMRLGCDPARMLKVRPSTAEEAIDLHDEIVRTGSIDLLVLDSLAAMTPSTEVEASAMEWQQGLQARLLNKMSRKAQASRTAVHSDFARPVTEIWINQERMKIGVAYGDNTLMPGGEGQKFTASAIVKMWASQWERATVDEDMKKEWQMEGGTDVRLNFKVIKNKTARAMIQGSYRMGVSGDDAGIVLDLDYMAAQAEKFGLMRKDGSKWLLGDETYKTKGDLMARMQEAAVRRALRERLVQLMLAA